MDQGQSNTGTRDSTYDLVAVLYHALQGVENCQTYRQDASGDQRIGQFFDQAIQMQRQLADQAKMLLHDRLMQETGGGQGGMSGERGEMSGSSDSSAFQFSGADAGGMSRSGTTSAGMGGVGGSGMSPSGAMSGDMTGGSGGGGQFGEAR